MDKKNYIWRSFEKKKDNDLNRKSKFNLKRWVKNAYNDIAFIPNDNGLFGINMFKIEEPKTSLAKEKSKKDFRKPIHIRKSDMKEKKFQMMWTRV